jgi:hypothetical protein
VVGDIQQIVIHTNFTNTVKQVFTLTLDDADAADAGPTNAAADAGPTQPPAPTPTQPTQTPTPTPTQPTQPTATPAHDTEPPTAPTNLRAIGHSATSASLAWDAATDNVVVTEYALYSSATLVLTTTGLSADIFTLSQLASEYQVHPTQITQWKKQLLAGATSLFGQRRVWEQHEQSVREAELFEQIGRLKMELEWLKKS